MNMGPVIGVDADVHRIAFAVLDRSGDVITADTIERSDTRGRIRERYDQELTALMRRASEQGAVVYIEGIFLCEFRGRATKRNVQGFASLAEVAGEIKRAARLCAVPIEVVGAGTWRSKVLGITRNRAMLKAEAMKKARSVTGCEGLSEHEADAVCIALYGATETHAAVG